MYVLRDAETSRSGLTPWAGVVDAYPLALLANVVVVSVIAMAMASGIAGGLRLIVRRKFGLKFLFAVTAVLGVIFGVVCFKISDVANRQAAADRMRALDANIGVSPCGPDWWTHANGRYAARAVDAPPFPMSFDALFQPNEVTFVAVPEDAESAMEVSTLISDLGAGVDVSICSDSLSPAIWDQLCRSNNIESLVLLNQWGSSQFYVSTKIDEMRWLRHLDMVDIPPAFDAHPIPWSRCKIRSMGLSGHCLETIRCLAEMKSLRYLDVSFAAHSYEIDASNEHDTRIIEAVSRLTQLRRLVISNVHDNERVKAGVRQRLHDCEVFVN